MAHFPQWHQKPAKEPAKQPLKPEVPAVKPAKAGGFEHTPAFLAAMGRVVEIGNTKGAAAAQEAFQQEMFQLGWEERIRNLYRIKDKDTGKYVIFKPNRAQEDYRATRKGRDEILKSRQIGFTTWSCIYAYDRALWDRWDTGIMSHKQEHCKKIFDIVKKADAFFKKDWGQFYAPVEEQNNTTRISWEDLKSSITVAYDFQGITVRFLHVSEAAFVDAERLGNSLQAVPESGEVILESTPNGRGGFYYDQWQAFKRDPENAPYRGHIYPWYEHYPENPENWETTKPPVWNEEEKSLIEAYDLTPAHLLWRRWKIAESFEGNEDDFKKHYVSDDVSCSP